MNETYYIVNKSVLPDVFEKVIEAKKLLLSKKCKTVNEAVLLVGISRSAFYKYKDNVSVYVDDSSNSILTLNLLISDSVGNLSSLLTLLSGYGASILTINQNIPTDDIAPITISINVKNITCTREQLIDSVRKLHGILRIESVIND